MTRGQAERLMPFLEEVLAAGKAAWRDLSALGVGVGPGNFTGIRIAVASARGLALGLDIPAVGVTGFASRAHLARPDQFPAVPAPRGQVYILRNGDQPELLDRSDAELIACAEQRVLWVAQSPAGLAGAVALEASAHWQRDPPPPVPLYVRPYDASPAQDGPPILLDE